MKNIYFTQHILKIFPSLLKLLFIIFNFKMRVQLIITRPTMVSNSGRGHEGCSQDNAVLLKWQSRKTSKDTPIHLKWDNLVSKRDKKTAIIWSTNIKICKFIMLLKKKNYFTGPHWWLLTYQHLTLKREVNEGEKIYPFSVQTVFQSRQRYEANFVFRKKFHLIKWRVKQKIIISQT